jgi:hypothetical protein
MKLQEVTRQENISLTNGINYPSWVGKVKQLDEWQKIEVYMNYYREMLSLKYNFEVVDKMKPKWKHGWDSPDKEHLGLALYFLWKDVKILDFESFISDKNIDVRDCGKDWEKQGFAQRWWVQTYGIYDWYWKNETDLLKQGDK